MPLPVKKCDLLGNTPGLVRRPPRGRVAGGLLLLLLAGGLRAEEPVPAPALVPEPVPVVAEPTAKPTESDDSEDRLDEGFAPASCIKRDDEGRFMGWMDFQHCVYSGRTLVAARWVDDLFGDWYEDEATLHIRTIAEPIWDEEAGASFNFRVRASARLPNASRRLRLVISDEREDLTNNDNGTSPATRRSQSTRTTAALRFIPVSLDRLRVDTDIGIRSGPDIFLRARARQTWGLTWNSVMRLGETLRYAAEDKGRALVELEFERVVDEDSVLRFTNGLSYWEREDTEVGARWSQGLSLSHALGSSRSLAYGIGTDGVTRPDLTRESYGLWLVYRQSFLRPWLFLELEPRLTRYRSLDWDTVPSVALRLEVQFGRR